MSSPPGEDDGADAWGERGSPPLRFGCFKPFWKRRKALPSSSTTAVAVPAGVQDDSETSSTAPMVLKESTAASVADSSNRLKVDGSGSSSTGMLAPTDKMKEEEHLYPSDDSSSQLKVDGPWSQSTGLLVPTGRMKEEEHCYSSDDSSSGVKVDGPGSSSTRMLALMQEEEYCYPSADSSCKHKVDGPWSQSTGLLVPIGKMKDEEYCSQSRAIGTTADARHQEAVTFSWDDVFPDLDYFVLKKVPSYYDRARLRCVCHRWNDATRNPPPPPPPLPLVINTDFSLINCFADGSNTAARPIQLPPLPFDDLQTACVGSFDDWIVCVYPREWNASNSLILCDKFCYVLNPSRQKVMLLPNPPAFQKNGRLEGSIQVENGSSAISYTQPSSAFDITFSKVALTVAPDTSNCKFAAISDRRGQQYLAMSMIGMSSWCFYTSDFISVRADLEFFEDSLFVLAHANADLYALHFGEQFRYFPVMVHAERCLIDKIPKFSSSGEHACSLVQSNKRLLLVVRHYPDIREQMTGVDVYMLDNKANPWQWVKISSLEGHCILISCAYNKSFPAYLYEEIEEDTIYFLDSMTPEYLPRKDENLTYRMLVYNLQDRTVSLRRLGSKPVAFATKLPMWFCPPE